MKNEKSNKKIIIFLLVVIGCLLLGGGFLTYKLLTNNTDTNDLGQQLDGSVVENTVNGLLVYEDEIPQVNLLAAKEFNEKVKNTYKMTQNDSESSVTCAIKKDVLFCGYFRSYSVAMDGDYETASFTYDLIDNKTLMVKDILKKFNIDVTKLDIEDYQLEAISGADADSVYYIMPSADGSHFEACSRGMGTIGFDFWYK